MQIHTNSRLTWSSWVAIVTANMTSWMDSVCHRGEGEGCKSYRMGWSQLDSIVLIAVDMRSLVLNVIDHRRFHCIDECVCLMVMAKKKRFSKCVTHLSFKQCADELLNECVGVWDGCLRWDGRLLECDNWSITVRLILGNAHLVVLVTDRLAI